MDITGNDSDVSVNSDESIEFTLEGLVSELADYREALCNLVIVSEDNIETSDFNPVKEDDDISNNEDKMVVKFDDGKEEYSGISIKSDTVCERFSANNKIKLSDLGIQDFQPRNNKSTSMKTTIPNVNTVVGKPHRSFDSMISGDTSETLNNSCRGVEAKPSNSNTKLSDYGSETPTNNGDKDTNASLDSNSLESTMFPESDSSIVSSHLKFSETHLGTSSTGIFTEEFLGKFGSTVNQDSSQKDLLNCNSEKLKNPASNSQRSTELSSSFMNKEYHKDNQELELKSSEDPETVLDCTSTDSSSNPPGILNAPERNSESSTSGLNCSHSDSKIRHSIWKSSERSQVEKLSEESSDELLLKLRRVVHNLEEDKEANTELLFQLISEICIRTSPLDSDQEASICSDAEVEKGIFTKTTNTKDRNSDVKFPDSDAVSHHSDVMFMDNDNESKSYKGSVNTSHVQRELPNLINTNDESQDLRQEEVIPDEAFPIKKPAADNDTEGSSTSFDDQKEPLVHFEDPDVPTGFPNASGVIPAKAFPNPELASDDTEGSQTVLSDRIGSFKKQKTVTFGTIIDAIITKRIYNTESSVSKFPHLTDEIFTASNREQTSDDHPRTTISLHNITVSDVQRALASTQELAHSRNAANCNLYNWMPPQTDQVPKLERRSINDLESLKQIEDQMRYFFSCQSAIQNQNVEAGTKMIKNEMSLNLGNADSLCTRTLTDSCSCLPDSGIENYFSESDSIPNKPLQISKRNEPSSFRNEKDVSKDTVRYTEEGRRQGMDSHSPVIKSNRTTPNDSVETNDSDADTLNDIFKTVIKCHPKKKLERFEIPPYELANAEGTLVKPKEGHDSDPNWNILEVISDTDSHSVMVFEVTDSFSQNSYINCDGLVKEYLAISAKVDIFLIKKIENISVEEYELRMRKLLSLHEELEHIHAKLMTTLNDWIKQFREMGKKSKQSASSCDLHHMGILGICIHVSCILMRFCCEKQLNLENYEKALIFERKRF